MPHKLKLDELGRLSRDEFRQAEKLPFSVILDNVRSMNNTGSVFRTCDAFRATALYLCGITGQPPHREIHKTAIGAEESVEWKYAASVADCVRALKESGCRIVGVEQTNNSVPLQDAGFGRDQHTVFIFGNEIDGISEELLPLCDMFVEIPQLGTKHSLNVAVSAGIVLWQYVTDIKAFE